MKKKIVLIGMMGSGKTTVGRILSKRLKINFIDTDVLIEKKCGVKIKKIFDKYGEEYFRHKEEKIILDILLNNKKPGIIALGGGAFLNKKLQKIILKETISIWLDVDVNTLNQRTKWNQKRPLLNKENNQKKINKLYSERKNIYKLANHRINCDKLGKKNIAEKIMIFYEKY